jgi:hypothetical protein
VYISACREWLPEDDLMFVLDAVATFELGGFRRRYGLTGMGGRRLTQR